MCWVLYCWSIVFAMDGFGETTDCALPTSKTTGTRCAPIVLKISLPSVWPGTVFTYGIVSASIHFNSLPNEQISKIIL